jgi:hypothetical protein
MEKRSQFRDWTKARRRDLSLTFLPEYFTKVATTWQGILWGGGVIFVAWGINFMVSSQRSWITWTAILTALLMAGYYVWREDYIRLIPKLTVLDKIEYHLSPTQPDGGMSVWIQLLPKCLTEADIEECLAWLREVRVWSQEDQKWKSTHMNQTLPLGWSFADEKHSPITLQSGNEKRLNVLMVHSSNKIIIPQTFPKPLVWTTSIYNNTDTFLLDITIRGKNCPPVDRYMTVKVGAEWDKPIVKFISKPDDLSLSA